MERAELDQWKAKEVARLLALVETERRYYQDIVATLPVGLLVVSADFQIISANRAFRRNFKLRSEEVLRHRLQEVLPLEGLADHVGEVLQSGTMRLHVVYEPPATPGERLLRVSIASLRNWEEEAEREALLLIEDLTEVRDALLAQPRIEAAPPPVVERVVEKAAAPPPPPDHSPAIRWEVDVQSLEVNPQNDATASLLGYSPEQWRYPGFLWKVIAPEDADWVREFFRQAAVNKGTSQCDHRVSAADGSTVWVRNIVRPLPPTGGAPARLAGVTIDITEVRAREKELVQAKILDAMASWSGRLTHDFNNLLMIVMGYGQEILDSLPARDARRSDLEEILRSAQKVSGMTRELMTLSRPPMAEPQVLDLNLAISSMAARLREILAGKCKISLSLDPRTGMVNVDPAQLEVMVSTLVRQAGQLAGAGASLAIETASVEIGTRYARPDATPRHCVKLKVQLSGVEIDPETRERLFEPLLAVKEPDLAPGLFPICGIVRQAEGEVHVEQEPGRGTVLALYLPWVAEPPKPAPQTPPEPVPSEVIEIPIADAPPVVAEAPRASATMLVVEDDPGIRALMSKILVRQGFVVLEASGGEEALKLAAAHKGKLDLLITDLMMPQMGGREVSERLRAILPEVNVLFVSGYTDDPMIQSGQLPEGTAFLQKPFRLGTLLDKVRDMLGHEPAAD